MDKYIGQMLDERYEILEVIGVGGMAVVCKALCHRLNRMVAIKILKDEFSNDEDFRRRFHAESQAVAMMSHPNIVNVYDVSHSNEMDYIVMELIDGITLKQYMEKKGILSWRETLHFSMQIAKALEHAHSRGIIHRDIKPHNIMILKDGSVKVADFGIARVASSQNTLTKEALGSVHYISPEQAKGGRVDNRTDIYSLGVVMYQMLTGRPPYDGDTPVSVAIQHINGTPLKPSLLNSNIPLGLEQITMHAMCADLHIRYASASDMLRDMEELRKNPSVMFNFSAHIAEAGHTRTSAARATPAVGSSAGKQSQRSQQTATSEKSTDGNQERNKRIVMIAVIACAVIAVIGIALAVIGLVNHGGGETDTTISSDAESLVVPNFVGMFYDEAAFAENYPGFEFVVNESSFEFNSDYAAGTVIRQDIEPKMTVKFGRQIFLSISKGEQGKMEDLTGMSIDNVIKFYAGTDIKIMQKDEFSDEVDKGYVIRTEPAVGEPLEDGATITVYVSKGAEQVKVPDLYKSQLSSAQSLLTKMNLSFTVTYDFSDAVDKDCIISQSPTADSEVDAGTVVKLVVSKGKNLVKVPSVTGLTYENALKTLTNAGFTVDKVEEESSAYPAGTVLAQNPDGGTEVAYGSAITLTVAKEPPQTEESESTEPSESVEEELP